MLSSRQLAMINGSVATVAYCWAVWWFSGLFATLVPHDHGAYETAMLSVVLIAPIPGAFMLQAIHWQLVALVSLIAALRKTLYPASPHFDESAAMWSFVGHAYLLLTLCLLHVVGFLVSIVPYDAIID
jgi:hypothetical protein